MASQIDICNSVLALLNGHTITSLTDNTKEAVIFTRIYDIQRQRLLRSHFWNFATVKVQLPQLTQSPAFEYDYAYQLPNDCLRVVRVFNPNSDWRVVGKQIHTNDTTLYLEYISDVTDEGSFDSLFTDAFIIKLAIEMVYSITGSAELLPILRQKFDITMKEAKQYDSMEDFPRQWDDGTWIEHRI